jgi:glycosyltransferase involved in cell wall biosynthesis
MSEATQPHTASSTSSDSSPESGIALSVIIPILNEEENIEPLWSNLKGVLETLDCSFEVIFIDDGSIDRSPQLLKNLAAADSHVKVIVFRRNFGQTSAMSAGFDFSSGEIIIPMDGDQQNDPADIPRLLKKIDEGFDVVSGWRKGRKDKTVSRVLPSVAANRLISLITGVSLHDYGCTLKAYRREVIKDVRLYGEMHRFIPIYASWQGARVSEIVVRHHPRLLGESKYGIERTIKVFLDLIVVKFLGSYAQKPIYVFGSFGLLCLIGAFFSGLFAIFLKYVKGTSFIETPMPLLAVLLFSIGFNSILMGLLAEMTVRTYFESQGKPTYLVRDKINFDE